MSETSIEWTDRSINPIRARNRATGAVGHFCEKVSPGCGHCYACAWNKRVRPSPSGGPSLGTGLDFIPQNRAAVEIFLDDAKLKEVARRKKPTKYFWCDMTDIFGEWVSDEMLDRCFAVMAQTPQHTHQILTKRADRMRAYCEGVERLSPPERSSRFVRSMYAGTALEQLVSSAKGGDLPWPLPNLWLGVSVEDQQRADERIPHLLKTAAAIRFLSVEPLIGPVDLDDDSQATFCHWAGKVVPGECEHGLGCRPRTFADAVDWVIVGGESGPGARPCDLDWIRRVHGACDEAGTHIFIKQLGARPYDSGNEMGECECPQWMESCESPTHPTGLLHLRNRKGGDMTEWPEDLRVREFPEARP